MAHVMFRWLRPNISSARCACLHLSGQHDAVCSYRLFSTEIDADEQTEALSAETDKERTARDVSRMPARYRNSMSHVMIAPEPEDWWCDMHTTIDYKRRLYAKYGRKSGLDPGILWPSKEEVEKRVQFEQDWEPSFEQTVKLLEEERRTDEEYRQRKRKEVDKQMTKMPQLIKEYYAQQEKVAEAERRQEEKKRELLEEARDFFGYYIDPSDPRFEEMQLRKEEEEKKERKQKKKEKRNLRILQGLDPR